MFYYYSFSNGIGIIFNINIDCFQGSIQEVLPYSPKVNNPCPTKIMSGFRILVGCKRVIDYAVKVY